MTFLSKWRRAGRAAVSAFRASLRGSDGVRWTGVTPSNKARKPPIKLSKNGRDLFGEPIAVEVKRPPGRPAHRPTAELRAKVSALHKAGHSQPEIAAAIGITVPTMWRHYPAELGSRSQAFRDLKNGRNDDED